MNEKHTEENQSDRFSKAAETGKPPARKRAVKATGAIKKTVAKKTATRKKPAEIEVTKTALKKTAAKKTAVKKVATKKAATQKISTEPLPFEAPATASRGGSEFTMPLVEIPLPEKKALRSKTPFGPEESGDAPAPDAPPQTVETETAPERAPRFGRVPGGGPTSAAKESLVQEHLPQAPVDSLPSTHDDSDAPSGHSHAQQQDESNNDGLSGESRSKRRRDKRKRRKQQQQQEQRPPQNRQNPQQEQHPQQHRQEPRHNKPSHQGKRHPADRLRNDAPQHARPIQLTGPKIETDGMLELAPKGFGFLRVPSKGFEQARDDVFVPPEAIRKYNLRLGQWIHGVYQEGPRGPQLVEIATINGMSPETVSKLPHFEELKAINPTKRISFETTPDRFTTRVVDIMAPVGRGQRGLIVSPPRSGKTTLLLHMAEAIREKYDEAIHLMVLLVDERPEEVTEFRRALPGVEIYASSNDEQARDHCRIAELAIERAKRLVEAGQDVFLLMDSITRLARAYNNTMNNRGRGTGSGGITIGALEVPRRLFAAARNTRGGGSLTIMATALIQTNSRADEAIFMEFKGTGNMELVLDRKIAETYIYPAVDIFKSGTRREELLIPDHMLHKIHLIRRGLSGHRPVEAMERLLFFLKKFSNNPQMLLEIKG